MNSDKDKDITAEALTEWFRSIIEAGGYGWGTYLEKQINTNKSTISRLKTGKQGFDGKTVNTLLWMQSSRDELFADYELISETPSSTTNFVYRIRQKDAQRILTWTTQINK